MTLKFFKKSICVLVVTLLILATLSFINRAVIQAIMLAAMIIWGIVCISVWQAPRLINGLRLMQEKAADNRADREKSKRLARRTRDAEYAERTARAEMAEQDVREERARRRASTDADNYDSWDDDDLDESYDDTAIPHVPTADLGLVRTHISHRISDKLRSVFPEASWDWVTTSTDDFVLNGGTTRIKTWGTEAHTHADVTIDRFAQIHLAMLTISPLETLPRRPAPIPSPAIPAAAIDVASWYSKQGYDFLNAVIQEINVYGYQKLLIRENGNIIHTKGDGTEVLSGTMPAFIPKTGWEEFISLLVRDELKASITGDSIQVAW